MGLWGEVVEVGAVVRGAVEVAWRWRALIEASWVHQMITFFTFANQVPTSIFANNNELELTSEIRGRTISGRTVSISTEMTISAVPMMTITISVSLQNKYKYIKVRT
jgi:hypothetical protein